MSPIKNVLSALLALMLVPALAVAHEEEEESQPEGWYGKGELGFVSTSGNTDSETLNALIEFIHENDDWRHRFTGTALKSSKDGETDAERYVLAYQGDRNLTERSYLFGTARYEQDEFAAYDPVTTVAAGYGYHFLTGPVHELKGEVGVGYRMQEDAVTGEDFDGAIIRLRGEYIWHITDNTDLYDTVLVEAGSDNTFFQNNFGVSVAINSSLALKVGHEYRHNTDVPPGVDKTDQVITTNVVYNFD